MLVRELITKLGYNVDKANLNVYNNSLKQISQNAMNYGRQMQAMGARMAIAFTLPVVMAGRAMIKASSDSQETQSKFSAVFKDIQNESEETAKKLSKDFGIATSTAQRYISDTGDMLTGFGFGQKEALGLSEQVQQLAMDLASFQNLEGGAERATRALTSGLLGERESMKSLGIAILEKDVKERVALMTTKGQTFATERQAKAVATLQLAMEQSKNAIGDVQRTWNDYANVERRWHEKRKELWEEYGKLFLPLAKKVLLFATSMIQKMLSLSDGTKKFILVISGIVAVVGPILLILGTMLTLFGGIAAALGGAAGVIAGIKMLGVVAAGLFAPFLKILVVMAAIFLIFDDIRGWLAGDDSFVGQFLDAEKFKEAWKKIMEDLKKGSIETAKEIGEIFTKNIFSGFTKALDILTGGEKDASGKRAGGFGEVIRKSLQPKAGLAYKGNPLSDVGSLLSASVRSNQDAEVKRETVGMLSLLKNSLSSKNSTSNGDTVINVNGAGDPKAVAEEVVNKLKQSTEVLASMEKFGTASDTPFLVNPTIAQ